MKGYLGFAFVLCVFVFVGWNVSNVFSDAHRQSALAEAAETEIFSALNIPDEFRYAFNTGVELETRGGATSAKVCFKLDPAYRLAVPAKYSSIQTKVCESDIVAEMPNDTAQQAELVKQVAGKVSKILTPYYK